MAAKAKLKWKINYLAWIMALVVAFIKYAAIPLACTAAIVQYQLAPTVNTDTVMAVFVIYLIIVWIRILISPPRYALIPKTEKEGDTKE